MYRVLKRTSVKRYRTVVHSSVLISIAFYIAVAVSGYVTFTGVTKGLLSVIVFV